MQIRSIWLVYGHTFTKLRVILLNNSKFHRHLEIYWLQKAPGRIALNLLQVVAYIFVEMTWYFALSVFRTTREINRARFAPGWKYGLHNGHASTKKRQRPRGRCRSS